MPMNENLTSKEPLNPSNAQSSKVGASLIIDGEVRGSEDLIINGRFTGKIFLENNSIYIAQESTVKADIRVKNITIKGNVEGSIHASGKVFITKEGKMTGDITAYRISIMDGAKFKGSVKMLSSIQPSF
ncbi:MAG TPA: polymer-forming cytoskeletal protein [Candidatus Aminicenantes bacterium]|nr:polymer-forming cytoskeletal protein [Candidatus Aminicenantes bacterium]